MAENSEFFCRAVAKYIQQELGIRTDYVTGIPWQERERLFDQGRIHIVWFCGLPYVCKADSLASNIELLAVQVPEDSRCQGRPVCFSDVVVRRESRFQSFEELRGASWAYNEPRSHSGYNVVRHQLAVRGERRNFFGRVVESGAHRLSLAMVLDGRVDGSAIDSAVLEWEMAQRPEISEQIRVIATFGPSPIPPWVISKHVLREQRIAVRELLLGMRRYKHGRAVLATGRIERFMRAEDQDYDPIRHMVEIAEQVLL